MSMFILGSITNKSTTSSDWKYVKFANFNTPYPAALCTSLGNNKWQYIITGGLRAYFGITDATEHIQKIAILFRNGNGTKKLANTDNSDMYIPVYDNTVSVRFTDPLIQPLYLPLPEPLTKAVGDNISLTAIANKSSTMKLYVNGTVIQTASSATTISANPVLSTGGNTVIVAEANDGTTTRTDTIKFFVNGGVNIAPLPTGVRDGINYETDNTAATFVLYAPSKNRVSVIGEFPGVTGLSNHSTR